MWDVLLLAYQVNVNVTLKENIMKIDSIEWHKNNLVNQKNYIKFVQDSISTLKADIELLELQINTATAKGKSTFDQARFCIKKNK